MLNVYNSLIDVMDDVETLKQSLIKSMRESLRDEAQNGRLVALADEIILKLVCKLEEKDRYLESAAAAFRVIHDTLLEEGKLNENIKEDKILLEYMSGQAALAKSRIK